MEPLRWKDTNGYPLAWRVKTFVSAWICQRQIGWTCAECKAHTKEGGNS